MLFPNCSGTSACVEDYASVLVMPCGGNASIGGSTTALYVRHLVASSMRNEVTTVSTAGCSREGGKFESQLCGQGIGRTMRY